MKGRFSRTLAAVLALVFLVGLAAFAQTQQRPPRPRPGAQGQQAPQIDPALRQQFVGGIISLQRLFMPPNPREMQRLSQMLGLTEAQNQAIRALYQQFANTTRPIREQRAQTVKEMLALMQQASPDKAAMMAVATRAEDADRAILSAELDFWIALKAILNAQQQTQLGTFMQQRVQSETGERTGPPGGPGGPPPPPPAP